MITSFTTMGELVNIEQTQSQEGSGRSKETIEQEIGSTMKRVIGKPVKKGPWIDNSKKGE